MPDPSAFDFLRIPSSVLVALDNREFHFSIQPWHYLIRMGHVLSMAGFFGGISLLDLRLMGVRSAVPLRPFAEHILPWLYATFAITIATGTVLFLYAPVRVGSHAYFVPKLILTLLGVINAALFHRKIYVTALTSGTMPLPARAAGAISFAIWVGVIVCAALNVEPAPKLLLR